MFYASCFKPEHLIGSCVTHAILDAVAAEQWLDSRVTGGAPAGTLGMQRW